MADVPSSSVSDSDRAALITEQDTETQSGNCTATELLQTPVEGESTYIHLLVGLTKAETSQIPLKSTSGRNILIYIIYK